MYSTCRLSRLKGLGVITMAAAALTGQGDDADNKVVGFIQVQEGHGVDGGRLAARLLQDAGQEHHHAEKEF